MIITRTPMRIPLGGGGTDLPSYYSKYGGSLVSCAIDKYMFIYVNRPMVDDLIRLKYSKTEIVGEVDVIQHDIARESLKLMEIPGAIEITAMADVPAGTGLGSSSCFAVGLLNALHALKREHISAQDLAEEACRIEIDLCGKPIGKQDQYLAAFGGITELEIARDGKVTVATSPIGYDIQKELENNILLFFTGIKRESYDILKEQSAATVRDEKAVVESLHAIKELGHRIKETIASGNLAEFGRLLDVHWQTKKKLSGKISRPEIDRWYGLAKSHGALGGKIMGAGGGGFFMFYCEADKRPLRRAMAQEGLRELHFKFDDEGSKVLVNF
ncbi:MAG: galactokinase [Candidatus Aureabacteria bacterium]|nr:galactokinase [Candidatus Auribacterota bacterium]